LNEAKDQLSDELFPQILDRWLQLDETLGRPVSVIWNNGRKIRGIATQLDSDGALLVQTENGQVERVTSGDVSLEKAHV
jgi:BirA family transcriptional regulator, biotin operon repressor / biotin---[acetyl-CoA-carboxylase] ligase